VEEENEEALEEAVKDEAEVDALSPKVQVDAPCGRQVFLWWDDP
jgi:hypothetical protein